MWIAKRGAMWRVVTGYGDIIVFKTKKRADTFVMLGGCPGHLHYKTRPCPVCRGHWTGVDLHVRSHELYNILGGR